MILRTKNVFVRVSCMDNGQILRLLLFFYMMLTGPHGLGHVVMNRECK